ncbi:MAG: IPT/TIG domain-containing protein [Chitinophagaceae bacterium]|nr:IPT/TIG domain-containing protein [Chitinophagaceae bacterium]
MKNIFLLLLPVIFFAEACKKEDSPPPPDTTLAITAIAPATGTYGTVVSITGKNFSTTAANNTVKVNGVTAVVNTATATELQITVPPNAGTGAITVQTGAQTATGPTWTHIYQATVSTLAGSGTTGYADGIGAAAQFNFAAFSGICVDAGGNIFISERGNNRIRKITATGTVSTVAGTGDFGYVDGPAATAQFNGLRGITIDAAGNLYVADASNHRIRKISTAGVVSTVAGTGVNGFADGPGNTAQFSFPLAVAFDNNSGNLYVTDQNYRLRKITAAADVSSIAGSGVSGYADGTGAAAQFSLLIGMVVAPNGDIYASDANNHRIRKITAAGVATTYAGSGISGNTNGPALTANFNFPTGIIADAGGNFYTLQPFNNNIKKISAASVVSTFAGKGTEGITNGAGSLAEFKVPRAIAISNDGIIYVVDSDNQLVRKIIME